MDQIEIQCAKSVGGQIRPPGSKSITNRALVCAALANGISTLTGALDSDDTRVMIDGLNQLGIPVRTNEARTTLSVEGQGGAIPAESADIFIGNSGTTVRFLASLVSLGRGNYRLDGVDRMRQRPIADLVDALRALGVNIESELGTGCPPVVVHANGITGGDVLIGGSISSQYLSSLMMASPLAQKPVRIAIKDELVSKPYVTMTARIMEAFGAVCENHEFHEFFIPPAFYQARNYEIEPDASAASYFWAAAAISGGTVKVLGLTKDALQGDVAFVDCLARMGCHVTEERDGIAVTGPSQLNGIDVDMNAISDTVQTLSCVALFANGPTRIRGVAHNRHKETDRIRDLATELRKFGVRVDEFEDGLCVHPGELHGAEIDTYDDHRMAMSLTLPGLRVSNVLIRDPGCTSKTYPRYFEDLAQICRF